MQPTLEPPATPADKAAEDLARARRKQATVKVKQGWRTRVSRVEDTAFARDAFALGEEFRRSQTTP
jgi:hypothetical protein